MDTADELERLLDEAREASPAERLPRYRDAIAGFGSDAIEPLTAWIDEPVFAAFAIRTLQRIAALEPGSRSAVIGALVSADRGSLPAHIVRDVDEALRQLGAASKARSSRERGQARQPTGRPAPDPGVEDRGYWAMRTSPWERAYVWAQAQHGRLRQGWGWAPEQNLEVIREDVRHGRELSELQQMSWPSRRMMLTEPDGMRLGDLILAPNIPEWGRVCVFRLTGSYEYRPDDTGILERFGHILPVDLLGGPIARHDPIVSDALRTTLRDVTSLAQPPRDD